MDLFEEILEVVGDVIGLLVDIFVGEQEVRMNPGFVLRIGVKLVMLGVAVGKFVKSVSEPNKKSRWQFFEGLRNRLVFVGKMSGLFRDFVNSLVGLDYQQLVIRYKKKKQ